MVILSPHAGGLGDSLIYSTLPQRFARNGHEVFIGRPAYEDFRNDEIREMVWARNPFVAGFRSTIGENVTHVDLHRASWSRAAPFGTIALVERLFGFEPESKLPQVHYVPKRRPEFAETIFVDPRSTSVGIDGPTFERFVAYVCEMREFDRRAVRVIENPNVVAKHGARTMSCDETVCVESIFAYADAVASCKAFLAAASGGIILASALRRDRESPELFAAVATIDVNDGVFRMPNVRYCPVRHQTMPDFP